MRIILLEDDTRFAELLIDYLKDYYYDVQPFTTGIAALEWLENMDADLCIVDISLPNMNGYEFVEHLNASGKTIPVIYLTGLNDKSDIIKGYTSGASDFITKPIDPDILVHKINATLRKFITPLKNDKIAMSFQIGDVYFNFLTRDLIQNQTKVLLSPKESEILRMFCEADKYSITREQILIKIWGSDNYFASRSMDVHIARLRKKLNVFGTLRILNLYKNGFKLTTQGGS